MKTSLVLARKAGGFVGIFLNEFFKGMAYGSGIVLVLFSTAIALGLWTGN